MQKNSVETPIAYGELIDKITILELKVERFTEASKIANAQTEFDLLRERLMQAQLTGPNLAELTAKLRLINGRLWDLEDRVRECERQKEFGSDFIAFARSIYQTNDERAAVKREINLSLGSALIEEKSYEAY